MTHDNTRPQSRRPILNRRSLLVGASTAGAAGLGLTAPVLGAPSARYRNINLLAADKPEIVFTYWGSPQEQEAVKQMTDGFNEQAENIKVKAQYVANDGYTEKVTTMLAGGNPPDLAYMGAGMAFQWALDGKTLDLKKWVDADPETPTLLENTTYYYDDGKVLSTSLATAIVLIYYNKQLFADAGVDAPPVTGETAWTWDQFVDVAKQLTKDRNGKTAADADFDPNSIATYGVSFQTGTWGYLPFVRSNGGDFTSADGAEFTLDSPEAIDAMQRLQDLIYVHHVAPTPAAAESLPATDVLMRTGKLAMDINGMWKVLDYSQIENFEWGMGVLPVLKEPMTTRWGIPIIISANCKYPDEAYEFYRWRYSPERIDLYARGLWMPIQSVYYTDEEKIMQWIDPANGVYPEEARQVLVDYALKYAGPQMPDYFVKNLERIQQDAVVPAIQALFANEGTAEQLLTQAGEKAAPLMQGRY